MLQKLDLIMKALIKQLAIGIEFHSQHMTYNLALVKTRALSVN